jgi:hypothetical protein
MLRVAETGADAFASTPSLKKDYLPFLPAEAALALFEASVFFWSLTVASCFLAFCLAFGDLSPMC